MSWSGFGELDLSKVEQSEGSQRLAVGNYTVKCTSAKVESFGDKEQHKRVVADFKDVDGDGVSKDELIAKIEADVATRIEERIDKLFEADEEADGLTEDEVSARIWAKISAADSDEDGSVTKDELRSHIEAKLAGDGSEDDDTTGDNEADDGNTDAEAQAVAAEQPSFNRRFRLGQSMARRRGR